MGKRILATAETAKKSLTFSFAGEEGYKAYDIVQEAPNNDMSKSGLIVELLNTFGIVKDKYGYQNALEKLKNKIDEI